MSETKYFYPIDFDVLAADLEQRGIDIAPTRITWLNLARCIATHAGEQGREAFHRIAAVWPDYSRHDSELCYNRALRQTGRPLSIQYLVKACSRHGINLLSERYRGEGEPVAINYQPQPKQENVITMKTVKPIKQEMMDATLPAGRDILGRCPLTDLLLNLYPRDLVLKAIDEYHVGFESFDTGRLDRSVLFWQVNEDGDILNAKRICYKAGGHRDKQVPPMLIWARKPQCLYGLHRYTRENRHMPVAIVESEKSALIMSIAKPQYLWMATGSLNNFNEHFLMPVKEAAITAFADTDYPSQKGVFKSSSFTLWERAAQQMNRDGWNIKMSNALEDTATIPQRMDKIDIADVIIDKAIKQHVERLKKDSKPCITANK